MAKKKNLGKFAFRLIFNVVVAAIILSLLTNVLGEFDNVIVSSLITMGILLFVVPMILQRRPGQETFLSFILAIPVGVVMLNLLTEFFPTITFRILDTSIGILSPEFGFLIGAYFLADLAFISLFRRK